MNDYDKLIERNKVLAVNLDAANNRNREAEARAKRAEEARDETLKLAAPATWNEERRKDRACLARAEAALREIAALYEGKHEPAEALRIARAALPDSEENE